MFEQLELEPCRPSVIKYKDAYVWLIMKGDSYTPGVLCSVWSISRSIPEDKNLIIMYTDDVSETSLKLFRKVSDYIVKVDYITHPTYTLKTQKEEDLYSKWKCVSYTKWQCLRLPFEKVLFMDADTITLDNIDHLFGLRTPAAPFNSPFTQPIGGVKNYFCIKNRLGEDGYIIHSTIVNKNMIYNAMFKNGQVFTGSTVLLRCNLYDFNMYMKMLNTKFIDGFGYASCHSMVDEQSLCYYYTIWDQGPELNWTNIHQRYNYIPWKQYFLKDELPFVIHYFSEIKPWNMKIDQWEDVFCWYEMFIDFLEQYKIDPIEIPSVEFTIGNLTYFDTNNAKNIVKNISKKFIQGFSKKFEHIESCLDIYGLINIKRFKEK